MSTNISKRSIAFHIFDVVLNIVIIVAIVAIIRTFVVSPFQIEGSSMVDTLQNKEYIVINKFRYLFHEPQRGDIVVFIPPTDTSKYYVKRIIGLPGETIVIRDGHVYLRDLVEGDIKLRENYLSSMSAGKTYRYPVQSGDTSEEVFTIPEDEYFVLGDNRQGSLDSRSFEYADAKEHSAFVPRKGIKGSVWFVALPVNKIHAFASPEYNVEKKNER